MVGKAVQGAMILPVAETIYDRLLSLPAFTEPAKDLIDQYVIAFEKVANHSAEIAGAQVDPGVA